MDAHSSFVYLSDNLPSWHASIDELAAHAAQKNTEFVSEYTRLVNQIRPKRKKSPSISSIHTRDEPSDDQSDTFSNSDAVPPPPDRVQVNPLEPGNKYLYGQARRKRKPGTSIRSGASGPQRFRSKNQVVVYYDGYLQERLDATVKSIGVARNNLRKGRTALAVARGFMLPSLTTRSTQRSSLLDDIRAPLTSRSTSALAPGKRTPVSSTTSTPTDEAVFLQVDKELETIQNLCETAAHQFLRDGDCKTELETIRQKFDDLLARANAIAESLKKVQDEHQEAAQSDKEHSDNTNGCTDSDGTLSSQPSLDVLSTPKLGPSADPSPLVINHTLDDMKSQAMFLSAPELAGGTGPPALMTDNIEVDDTSDQDSIVLDISHYRLTNPRRIRI